MRNAHRWLVVSGIVAAVGLSLGAVACDGGPGDGKAASSDAGALGDAALDVAPGDSALDAGPGDSARDAIESDAELDGRAGDADSASDGGLSDGTTVAGYLASLPGWPPPLPDSNGPVDGGPDAAPPNYVTGTPGADGSAPLEYVCTNTEYSLTSTPTQIVTLDPNVDVLWPGALLQGGPLRNGALVGLPITQRAPITVSIPTLLSANNSQVVPNPSVATTENAIGALVDAAVKAGVKPSSSVSYTQTEAFSASQVALSLGFSADYAGSHLSGDLNLSESASLHTVVGYFVQKMFTVAVPEPEQPADFFNGLSQDTLNQFIAEGDVGPTNLPVYVASVTYGRLMMFSITASASTQNIETALSSQFNGLLASGSVDARYSSLQSDSSFSFRVVTVGGSAADAEALIKTGDPSKFFSSDPAISTGVPISYVLRNLSDNSIAAVSQTTDYTVQSCQVTARTAGANFYVLDARQGTIHAFDYVGNAKPLTYPVTVPNGAAELPRESSAIAYDSNDDDLYVITREGGGIGAGLDRYGSDGFVISTGIEVFGGNGDNSVSYDATHDQILYTGTGGADESRTPAGDPVQEMSFDCQYQLLYVPTNDELYCLDGANGVQAYTFGLNLPVSLSDTAFAAIQPSDTDLADGEYGAYDPVHDRLWIGYAHDLWSFTTAGAQLGHVALSGSLSGLAYDYVNLHVAAALDDATVALFTDDGAPVPTAPGAFSGFAVPRGLAFRP
jgi:hypothetical protein